MAGASAKPKAAPFEVVIAGGGVGALETMMALRHFAGDRVRITMVSDSDQFVYRPLIVREAFAYPPAPRYPLAPIAADHGAELVRGRVAWVSPQERLLSTDGGEAIRYDALLVALGTIARPHYEHAVTVDAMALDDTLHSLARNVNEGRVHSVAFVVPPTAVWALPIYELALMMAHGAYSMSERCEISLITPETAPLAMFGDEASKGVSALLALNGIKLFSASNAEVPDARTVLVRPSGTELSVNRVVALPELVGAHIRGLPVTAAGFLVVDESGAVEGAEGVYAVGDITDFPVKFGGVAAQQADVAAGAIAALAGAKVAAETTQPKLQAIIFTGEGPRYLTAELTGREVTLSRFSERPPLELKQKIFARFLAPYLDQLERPTRPEPRGRTTVPS